MSGLRIQLFGPPRLEKDGQPVPFGRSKALALLAYLCRTGGPASRDSLIDLLWPLFDPQDARNNLRRELSILKHTLPEHSLITNRQIVGFESTAIDHGRIHVDLHEFEGHLNRARGHVHPGNESCEDCIIALESAVSLYTGDFLAGFSLPDSPSFDDWQFHQAEQLRRELGGALERLAAWYAARGEYEHALGYGTRHAALDPLDEATQRDLMRLYDAAGQQPAALRHYEQTRRTLKDELAVEPEPETFDLYEAIRKRRLMPMSDPLADRDGKTTVSPAIHLPADATPFIGRKHELDQLDRLIADPTVRLITILSIGGMGKTRLALAAARNVIGVGKEVDFIDGIFFIPLAPLTQSAEIAHALALGLGFTPGGDENPSRQLIAYLKPLRALVIVDNVEHLIDESSITLFNDILRESPGIKILATSRTRLGLAGEHSFQLGGLGEDVRAEGPAESTGEQNDAVALYAEAARRARPSFRLDEHNIEIVKQICRLLGGMPLALELAAGWTTLLTPEAILEEVKRSLDFLESNLSDMPPRQASLKAVFDSSWRLLSEVEQGALRCLSVFPGTFGIEASVQVAGASLQVLLALANKSWVQPASANRFQVHPLLRQYSSLEIARFEKTETPLRDRHALYYANLLAALEGEMRGRRPAASFDVVAAELDNIRAAISWLVESDYLELFVERMAIPLFRYLESRYQYFLFSALFIEATKMADARHERRVVSILRVVQPAFFFNGYPTRFMDYHWGGYFWTDSMKLAWDEYPIDTPIHDFWIILMAWQYGRFVDVPAGVERLRQILGRLENSDYRWEEAFARQCLGRLLSRRPWDTVDYGEEGEARELLREALGLFESLGDEREAAITLLFIGLERQSVKDLVEAKRILMQAQARLRSLGENIIAANVNWQLAEVHMSLGEFDASLRYFHEMADILLSSGRVQLASAGLSRESYEAVRYGDLDDALRIRESSLALSRRTGERFNEAWDHWEMGEIFRVMGRLEEARIWYESSWAIFKEIDNESGNSFYYRGLGDLSLTGGDPVEAESHFRTGLDWSQRTAHLWQEAYALGGLGRAATALGKFEEARHYFTRGLRSAWDTGDLGIALAILGGIADYYQQTNHRERAESLARTILAHTSSWRETRRNTAALLGLPMEVALDRSGSRPFDLLEIVAKVIEELEKSDQEGS